MTAPDTTMASRSKAADKTISKRCSCRTSNGKEVGQTCPKLRRADGSWSPHHGTWRYQLELPRTAAGKRRQMRRQGFDTRDDAIAERNDARELIAVAGDDADVRREVGDLLAALRPEDPLPDRDSLTRRVRAGVAVHTLTSVGAYLNEWFTQRRGGLAPNTALSYEDHIRRFLQPHLGHIALQKLRAAHIQAMFTAIQIRNTEILTARASTTFEVRNSVRGIRVVGPTSQQRILATLRKALNDAIRMHRLIEFNPATAIDLKTAARVKPRVWTSAAVAKWRRHGVKPAPVMVWTPQQFGTFLDYAEQHAPELVDLYELMGQRGLRRGEVCGLRDGLDVDLEHGLLTIEEQVTSVGYELITQAPKSEAGSRDVPLGVDTITGLRRYKARRAAWKLAAGTDWIVSDRFFVRPDGAAWHPERVSKTFDRLVAACGLPPIRLHDLRHTAATLMLAAGASLKEVQETLGHSQYQITADIYTSVLEELQKGTADRTSKLVPRARNPRAA